MINHKQNMLRPAVNQILRHNESPYSLVVAVAKRAREITEEADSKKVVMDKANLPEMDKPVMQAVDEFASGKVKLIEPNDIGVHIEE